MSNDTFNQWKQSLDTNFLRYNVSLYQLKYVYEKDLIKMDLKNPSLFPEQECLKPCDFLFIHRYLYDSIKTEELENTYETEYKSDANVVVSNIISNINSHGEVRVGFFTRRNNDSPTYFLLSTHNEDEKYYVKCDQYMYDDIKYIMCFMVRYNIDYNASYMLSGMKIMDKNYMSKYGMSEFPICPYNDEKDKRFYEEYFDSFDLTRVFDEFKILHSVSNDYELVKLYKESDRICEIYGVPTQAYQYFKNLN